eukprot:CFRG5893T1
MSISQSVIAIMDGTDRSAYGHFYQCCRAPVAISENSDDRPTARIVGGAPVAKRIPFLVWLYNPAKAVMTVATIVVVLQMPSKDWMLTAGHCVRRGMTAIVTHGVH